MILISFMYIYCTYTAEYRRKICKTGVVVFCIFWYIQDIFIEIFGEAGQSGQNWSIDIFENESVDMSQIRS